MSETSAPRSKCPRCGDLLPPDSVAGLCPRCLMAEAMQPTQVGGQVSSLPVLTPEELAPHFPQLEILQCLGRGGMGVVYKARQKSLNRWVALKLLAPERANDAEFAERFAQEAHALAALNHPNIVAVYDFGQAGGFFFLLMEFVDGVNLRQAMKAGRFTPEQALAIVPPVCEALQYAHEHGIVHRDIKPENLLLDKEGRVKIADFGIAKMLGNDATLGLAESQPAGTPQYMAPEQKDHQRTDHRADIYSLGVVLYEMLTGELPAVKLQPPSRKVQIDVRLDEVVLRALEKTPELRYQTAGEMRTQVETIAFRPPSPSAGPQAINPTQPVPTPGNPLLRGVLWLVVVFLGMTLLGLGLPFILSVPARHHAHVDLSEDFGISWVTLLSQLLVFGGLFVGLVAGVIALIRMSKARPGKALAIGCSTIALAFLVLLLLPLIFYFAAHRQSLAEQKAAAAARAALMRTPVPISTHVPGDNGSVMVVHDNQEVHYVCYFAGRFESRSGLRHTNDWTEEGNIQLINGPHFDLQREMTRPFDLQINGQHFQLQRGRVFVLLRDGTVEQLPFTEVGLQIAKDPAALARLIAQQNDSDPSAHPPLKATPPTKNDP